MSCDNCGDIRTTPPYANATDVANLFTKACADCTKTTTAGTASSTFCATLFGGSADVCCDLLYVLEGTNVWVSSDCTNWFLITGAANRLFYTETKADSLSGSFLINSIPTGYNEIIIEGQLASTGASLYLIAEVNGDAVVANYNGGLVYHSEVSSTGELTYDNSIGIITNQSIYANHFTDVSFKITNYENSSYYKNVTSECSGMIDANGFFKTHTAAIRENTADVTSIEIFTAVAGPTKSGTFNVGSMLKAWVR